MLNSKQYFVKYTNLAHVHNLCVPKAGSIDTHRGPDLLSLLKNRNHTEKEITFVVNFCTENR
jgi:chromodomain-helicase-DNA-binding protein 3